MVHRTLKSLIWYACLRSCLNLVDCLIYQREDMDSNGKGLTVSGESEKHPEVFLEEDIQ